MKIVYTGVHDAVEISDGDGRVYRCERDEPFEIPDDLAEDLLAQSTWEAATSESKTKARKRTES